MNRSIELPGPWEFRTTGEFRPVLVPHTYNVEAALAEYAGPAEYRLRIDVPQEWRGSAVRLECEAVYHTAEVFLDGRKAGEHRGKGYTAFRVDLTPLLRPGTTQTLTVKVDNSFADRILPRDRSYDWTMDGGLYRPVRLLITPPTVIEGLWIDTSRNVARARIRNTTGKATRGTASLMIRDASGTVVARAQVPVAGAERTEVTIPFKVERPVLWHFDRPYLYQAEAHFGGHEFSTSFGFRTFEVKDGGFYLNGERVWLGGVERMAGSHPGYGMAEPLEWIEHDCRDMKELNCVFTRVHWMQDRRLLDYGDRHGILMQLEVPTWGPQTFKGMKDTCDPDILQNGLEHLQEMIEETYNHPSVVVWGLCNEIPGKAPAAKHFARELLKAARRLDPSRPLTHASNTLHLGDPRDDVAGEMDFLSWNEYFESWMGGSLASLEAAAAKIRAAYPDKPLVVSEYGLCECSDKNPTGDDVRARVMRTHGDIMRKDPKVAGLIFFCYNDYRTHMGDKGRGVLRQRVHGVVDVYGNRKPSFEALRNDMSPVGSLSVAPDGSGFRAELEVRRTVPCHALRGYQLRWIVYGFGGLPMEQGLVPLPELGIGARHSARFAPVEKGRVVVDILRPTGFSARTAEWRPA